MSMKIIGLIGGLTWLSTAEYYRLINQMVKNRLGGHSSAKILMYSFDFKEIVEYQRRGEWVAAAEVMVEAARRLERGGSDFLIICANTMHKTAEQIEGAVSIPLIHIADAAAGAIKKRGLERIGLLGTIFTMTEDFYKDRLQEKHGLAVLVPDEADMAEVNRIIYDEIIHDQLNDDSRRKFQEIIKKLIDRSAQGIVLGCTEIPLLIKPEHVEAPLFDTTQIHAEAAVEAALSG